MKFITVNRILWLIFISLLAVLLPHTAWLFSKLEPAKTLWVSYPAAFAFEAAIAALVHKLAKHIETTPKRKSGWEKFFYRYWNAYSVGLVVAIGISSLANLAHAVEFGQPLKIFTDWGVPQSLYSVAFGAVLPMVSLVFALVLSNVTETESETDPALLEANKTVSELRRELRDIRSQLTASQQRFDAMGDLFVRLTGADKRERILAASQQWPGLPGKYIAVVTDSTPSYVSEVLSEQ